MANPGQEELIQPVSRLKESFGRCTFTNTLGNNIFLFSQNKIFVRLQRCLAKKKYKIRDRIN